MNNNIILKIPEKYTFGEVAFLVSWIEETSVYAIIVDKRTNGENVYFFAPEELKRADCIIGVFKSGETFKVYIPDASWGNIKENSYTYTYSIPKEISNSLDSVAKESEKASFRSFQENI